MPDPLPPPSTSDRAFVLASLAWGVDQPSDTSPIWRKLSPDTRARLLQARAVVGTPASPLDDLQQAQRSAQRLDPDHIHPTWWRRALADESPAVRLAVLRHAPDEIRRTLGEAPAPDDAPLPHLDALRWALALWTERLVGGPPAGPDDAPIIRALGLPSQLATARLVRAAGLVKLAYAVGSAPTGKAPFQVPVSPPGASVLARLVTSLPSDTRLARLTTWDVEDSSRVAGPRRDPVLHLGSTTAARLLAAADPQRARWALQRLPYALARELRTRMTLNNPLVSGRSLVRFESSLWQLAQQWADSARPRAESPSS